MNATVTTTKEGHACQVRVDGEVVASFDEISNDYAYTTQAELARLLRYYLPLSDNIKEAVNKSFHDL